jgi:hypothetical protein
MLQPNPLLRALRHSLVVLSGTACAVEPDDLGRCSGELPIVVEQSDGVRFTWAPPDCLMYTLVVDEARTTRWYIWSPDRFHNQIASGVEYGRVPPGLDGIDAARLWVGNRYHVLVSRMNQEGREVVAGRATFVKQ